MSLKLGPDAEFGGFEGVGLRHGSFGAVDAVVDEAAEELETDLAGELHALFAGVVDEDEHILHVLGVRDVDVLAQFDGAVGAGDERAAVAPGAQRGGREPVDAEIHSRAVVADERAVAEVFELGMVRVIVVGDFARLDGRVFAAGVGEELFDLVAADVAEDAAVLLVVVEPVGAFFGWPQAVRAEAGDLDNTSDNLLPDQFGGVHRALDVQTFGVIHHVFLARAGDGGLHRLELFEAGQRRLVREVVLAGVHTADAQLSPQIRDRRGGDELNLGVVEDRLQVGGERRAVLGGEFAGGLGVVGIEGVLERRAGLGEAVGLAVDVAVVHRGDREAELAWPDHGIGLAGRGVIHAVRSCFTHCGREILGLKAHNGELYITYILGP